MAKSDGTKCKKRQCKAVTNDVVEEENNVTSESQMNTTTESNQSASTVPVTLKKEDGQDSPAEQETKAAKGKRKAGSNTEASPPKKTRLINDGFCLFVGNLNKSKTVEEVREALASYLMTQSLLVQNIRLHKSRKHAFVDLASEMDLTKALTLNGEMILDQPMKIAKAKVKIEDKVEAPKVKAPKVKAPKVKAPKVKAPKVKAPKVKAPKVKASKVEASEVEDAEVEDAEVEDAEVDETEKDERCLQLKNIPYKATKEDILEVFQKAIDVRFPGKAKGPTQGIAFVEFKNKTIAKKVLQKKQGAKIQDRLLIVNSVGDKKDTKAEDTKAPPNNILFVSNLSFKLKEQTLKKVFKKAVSITMPQGKEKSKGYAFVEFATVEEAEKALQVAQDRKISKRLLRVQFFKKRENPPRVKVKSKTLIVSRLNQKTTAETLRKAFEGALSARIVKDKETGVSKSFGFVEFASDDICKTAKEAMEDCEIDGCKVALGYARPKTKKTVQGATEGVKGHPGGQPAGQVAGRGRKAGKRGKGHGAKMPAAKEVENKG